MKYKIEITAIETVKAMSNEWRKVRDVPDELKKKPGFYNGDEGKEIPEYAYVPTERTQENSKTIYSQTVDELDLVTVIKAVNGVHT